MSAHDSDKARSFKYKAVALGGTFDHIHRGHRELLKRAFETGNFVYIGLTSDAFAASSGKKIDHTFEQRKRELTDYLRREYPNRKFEITKLENRFGPGIFTANIEALVVSDETFPHVESANKKRAETGLPPLKVEVVPMLLAEDKNRISSTRIRAGEIDAEGKLLKR